MSPFFQLSGATKNFGGVRAVDNMSFGLEKGELVGLMGPNGAGKTTIFNLVTGVYGLDEGEIRFKGEDLGRLKSHQITDRGIARTFQNLRLFQRSSALDNVMTAAQYRIPYTFIECITHLGSWRKKEKMIREKSMGLLERVGLADRADQAAGTLPYGFQRRLEIARALALDPELLLLDEPAAGMNAEEVSSLNVLIKDIHRDFGLTILVIEHHMDLVMEICPRIICMNFGAKIAEGTPGEIQNHPEVLKAYLGEEEDDE
ncbi:MAG: ABC transporter ATP-binding protein [Aminivibrio sp.]|jgi:branched-chain amino acid transport system ATP-binding protein